jgi:putative flippase GtrA
MDWYGTPQGRRMVRYTLVSAVAVPVGSVFYLVALQLFGWSPGWSGVFGASAGAVPSYYLNRSWAWGKTGKSHLWKEVLPFWVLALIGVLFSGWTQSLASHFVKHHGIHDLSRVVILYAAYIGGFGVLWIGKYFIFNKVLFVVGHHHPHADPAINSSVEAG